MLILTIYFLHSIKHVAKMDVSGHVLVSRYIHITDMFYEMEEELYFTLVCFLDIYLCFVKVSVCFIIEVVVFLNSVHIFCSIFSFLLLPHHVYIASHVMLIIFCWHHEGRRFRAFVEKLMVE
jgi:hypothetical protein